MQPGETHKFSFYTKPTFKAGCCTSKVYFSTIQDPDDILATLDVDIKVNDPECLVSTKLVLQDEVRIFPNPVSNSVQITGHPSIEKMKIYSVLGELVKELDAKGKTSFDVNDLISGTYFIALTGKENELLKTSRITKQ
ncbi:MAG: T9SS type A sorting domain-containing protein [Saprospiraceae bacterium]|nr:T9SS type A sorting domain-containing protein [Saprospiraceae bacterium]